MTSLKFILVLLLVFGLRAQDNTVHYIISTGQSLSVGVGGSPCLSMFQPPLGASGWVSHAQGSWPGYNLKLIGTNSVVDYTECRPTNYTLTAGTVTIDTSGNVSGHGTAFTSNQNRGIMIAGTGAERIERVFTYIDTTTGRVTPAPSTTIAESPYFLSSTAGSFASVERHHMGMVNTLTELHPAKDYVSMTTPWGVDGRSYTELTKNPYGNSPTNAYSDSIAGITAAKNYVTATDEATGRPRPFVVSALNVVHGESDFGASAMNYVFYLRQWLDHYRTDAMAVTGQAETFPLFTDQYSSHARIRTTPTLERLGRDPVLPHPSYPAGKMIYNTATQEYKKNVDGVWTTDTVACVDYTGGFCPSTPIGQWWAARVYPGEIYLVGPKYQYRYSDGLHLMNYSYRLNGEMHGKAMAKVLHEKKPWVPLAPRSLTISEAVITAQFHVPVGCLQFDTDRSDAAVQMLPKTDMGFEYFDDTSSASIADVSITSCDTVTITLNTPPTGTNQRLRYAYTGFGNAGTASAARGNLADTDPAVGLDGLSLRDYAIMFDEPLGFSWEPSMDTLLP